MPSLSRRRETDYRAERLESEIRAPEAQSPDFAAKKKYLCNPAVGGCGHLYEERSKNCPRCDKRTMGEVRQVPERHLAEFQRNALRRLGRGR